MRIEERRLLLAGHAIPLAPRPALVAAVAEVRAMPAGLRLWLAGLAGLLAIGGVAALIALPPGWEVMGTNPSFEWGLLIVGYAFFAVMTSGLCLASSLGTVFGIERFRPFEKRHAVLAVLSLTTAFGLIALELHYPVRMVFGAILVPSPSSPMWWMGVFYAAYLVVLLVEVWSMFTSHPVIHQWACTVAAGLAVLAPATLGAVFGVLESKPFWHGAFSPVQMVASAFLAGTALLGIVFYAVHRLRLADVARAAPVALPSVRLLLALGLALVSMLLVLQIADGLLSDAPALRPATLALVSGPLAAPFWVVRVIAGLAVPAVLLALPATRTPAGTAAAAGLALLGMFTDRLLFVLAGQIIPRSIVGGDIAYPYAAYTPTLVEVAIMAGAVAFLAMAYTLAERYLDMGEGDVHIGFAFPWVRRPGLITDAAALDSPEVAS